jgi:hypothetical protein
MLQPREPTGTTCGFDASLRIYLRSSPIVCALDAAFILIRFVFYIRRYGYSNSLIRAAKEIRTARGLVDERPRPEEAVYEELRPRRLLSPEFNTYLLYSGIALGCYNQSISRLAGRGLGGQAVVT